MAPELVIDPERSLATIRVVGSVLPRGVVAVLRHLVAHPDWRTGMNVLVDYREASFDQIESASVHAVAHSFQELSEQLGDGRWAMVVSDELQYGLSRMFQLLTDGLLQSSPEVFRSIEQGRAWIEGG